MTKRILGLLWRIALVPQAPSGLDMTAYFADVLRDYAIVSRSEDTRSLALDYVSQLVHELSGNEKAVPAMRVLSHLIAPMTPHAVRTPFSDCRQHCDAPRCLLPVDNGITTLHVVTSGDMCKLDSCVCRIHSCMCWRNMATFWTLSCTACR